MLQSVCRWLEACKGVNVQQSWVEACLAWIEREEGHGLPAERAREMVYEQWLHADLRDVGTQPCMPSSLVDQQTSTITGHFVVQVDSVVDVGAAAYAQMQKIKGQSLDDGDTKKNFEPKPTRLLLLSLTDGVNDFQGMEYHPIPQLTPQLTPGTKLLLRGTINCRLGTLLLTGDQVEVLGGGVEALAELNTQRRVLARALNDESMAAEGGGGDGRQDHVTDSMATAGSRDQQLQSGNGPDEVVADVEIGELDLQNFDDFEEMEGQQGEHVPSDNNFSPHTSIRDEGEDEEVVRERDRGGNNSEEEATTTLSGSISRSGGQKRRHEYSFSGESVPMDDFSDGYHPLETDCEAGPSGIGVSGAEKRSRVQVPVQRHCVTKEGYKGRGSVVVEEGGGSSDYGEWIAGGSVRSQGSGVRGMRVAPQGSGGLGSHRVGGGGAMRNVAVSAVRPLNCSTAVAGPSGESVCNESTPQVESPQGGCPTVESVAEATDVWIRSSLVRIKARFVRVASKLTPSNSLWTVEVVLEDDAGGQLNVKLNNQVLEKLIGFSAREFVENIQPNKSDPAIRAIGSKGFKHCQSCLATLNCLMEIKKPATFGDVPTVERLLDSQ